MLTAIETAIINRITNAAALSYLLSVESYGGQLEDSTFDMTSILPAVWVSLAGAGKPQQQGSGQFLTPAIFTVMGCAHSARGQEAVLPNGPAAEICAYQIIEDVKTLLLMQDMDLDIDPLRPGAIRTLYNTRLRSSGLTVFAQDWHTRFVDAVPPEADETELLEVSLSYLSKPGDDVSDVSGSMIFTR